MRALTRSFFEASFAVVAMIAGASLGGCNDGDIPIGTLDTSQEQVSCKNHAECPKGQGCAPSKVCAPECTKDSQCKKGDVCEDGLCTAPCAHTVCSGACVDLQTDPSNCGACGDACKAGETCTAGACTGASTCMGTLCGSACVDLQTDPSNCGTCGDACKAGETCTAGTCTGASTCMGTLCGSACVDLQTDPSNCGTCGDACKPGDACTAGACTAASTCTDGIKDGNESDVDCGGSCPPCGSGKECNATSDCVSGDVCDAGVCEPAGTCGAGMACTQAADCPSVTSACLVATCTAGCCGTFPAPAGTACTDDGGTMCDGNGACVTMTGTCTGTICGSACVDLQTDPNNCGLCGATCKAGDTCTAGACTAASSCTDGIKDGNESDVDCGGSCPPCESGKECNQNSDCISSDVCQAGICQPSSTCTGTVCASGCVDLQTDPNNCGACGDVCLPGTTCTAGACLCPGALCGGTCVSTSSDPNNCGTCGHVCSSGDACVSGVCAGSTSGCTSDAQCPSGELCVAGVCQSGGSAACDPLADTGCQAGFACQISLPYISPSTSYICFPAGNVPPSSACSPSALCEAGSGCIPTGSDPDVGVCHAYCALGGSTCAAGQTCKSLGDPTVGVCEP